MKTWIVDNVSPSADKKGFVSIHCCRPACLFEYISKYSLQELQFVASFYVTLYLLVGIFNLGCLFILKIILISITY